VTALAAVFGAAALVLGAGSALAAYTAQVKSGKLTLTGDGASDKVSLRLDGASPNILQVDVGEDGSTDFSFDRNTFTAIVVNAGAGDDEIRIDQSGGLFTDEAVTLNGGDGNDTIIDGNGNDKLIGGAGNDFVDGNIGSDVVSLGTGNDVFEWDPGDGSDVIEGGGDDDTIEFNGSNANEHITLAPNGTRVLLTRDVAAITMDANAVEHFDVHLLGGTDTLTVQNLAGTKVKTVDADLAGFGGVPDGAADTVVAVGSAAADQAKLSNADGNLVVSGIGGAQTRVRGGDPSLDVLDVATLGGDDTLTADATVTGDEQVTFDGGDGQDTTFFNGTAGNDQIGIARNGTAAATFTPGGIVVNTPSTTEKLVVSGLDGDDTITGQNGIGAITALTIDGGNGNDTIAGGDGNDRLIGGDGNDHVDGNIGSDNVSLGAGDDVFEWDPGDGSDTIAGGTGTDRIDFNGSNAGEKIELSANGPRLRLTRDIAAITMDAFGVDAVNIETLGSADTVTVDDLSATQVRTVHVDLNGFGGVGDGAADTVVVDGTSAADHFTVGDAVDGSVVVGGLPTQTQVFGGEGANDKVVVAGLGGDDTLTSNVNVTGPIPVVLDGGDGVDTATFQGSAAADQIGVTGDAATEALAFTSGPTAPLGATTTVESFVVQGLDGDDSIIANNGVPATIPLKLDGGAGNDTLAGGPGADLLIGGDGNDLVDGNIGADTARLGAGDDTFQWDPGDGSDVVEGGSGQDTIAFNGSNAGERIELSANGSRLRLTRDIAAITMDANGMDRVSIRALGSADTITVDDLSATNVRTVDVDLSGFDGNGDGAADNVVVNGTSGRDVVNVTRSGPQVSVAGLATLTRITGSEPANDTLLVQTLDGDDDVTVAPDVADVINPVVDLGPGG
jgi:Ca2+-binding RTX toxin-like protein